MRSNLYFLHHEVLEDAVNKDSGMMDEGVSKTNRSVSNLSCALASVEQIFLYVLLQFYIQA